MPGIRREADAETLDGFVFESAVMEVVLGKLVAVELIAVKLHRPLHNLGQTRFTALGFRCAAFVANLHAEFRGELFDCIDKRKILILH